MTSLKKTPNSLTEQQVHELGVRTEGFSGSDIAGFLKEALMQPVKLLQRTNAFKRYVDPKTNKEMWYPVPPEKRDKDCKELHYMSLTTD